jgi:peptide subunit release factor 1 (eRF1)
MDGNGALFGTLSGNTREILQRLQVDLPKKHVSTSNLHHMRLFRLSLCFPPHTNHCLCL